MCFFKPYPPLLTTLCLSKFEPQNDVVEGPKAQESEHRDKCQLCLFSCVLDYFLLEILLGKSEVFLEPWIPHRWKRGNYCLGLNHEVVVKTEGNKGCGSSLSVEHYYTNVKMKGTFLGSPFFCTCDPYKPVIYIFLPTVLTSC